MWFNALVIIVAIGCAVTLMYLRAFLAVTFPSWIIRRLPEGFPPPTATADLYEKAATELAALGFSPPQWIVVTPEKETPSAFAMIGAVFCHTEKNALALLLPPLNIAAPNELDTHFITRLADGRELNSQVHNVADETVANDKHLAQTISGVTLAEQWMQHLRWVERFNTPTAVGFGSLETLSAEIHGILDVAVRLVSAGKLWRDAQGVARPTLAFALRFLWLHWTRPRPKANKTNVPLARQLMFAMIYERWQKCLLPTRWRWLLLVAWGVLFVVLGTMFLGLPLTLVFLGIFILHAGGHYLASRLFDCQHKKTSMLPLLGCATADMEQKSNPARHAWSAMMGALPGIVLGWALLGFIGFDAANTEPLSATALTAATLLLFLNYFTLLPIQPLVGAHIVQAILPPQWLIVRTAFLIIICLALVVTAFYFGLYSLIVLALILYLWAPLLFTSDKILWIPSLFTSDRIVRLLAADTSFSGAAPDQQQRLALSALQQHLGETTNMPRRLQQARTVAAALAQTAINWKHRVTLATVYLGLWCLPLIFWGLTAMGTSAEQPFSSLQIDPEKQKQTQQRVFLSLEGMKVPQLLAQMPEPEPPKPSGGWFARLKKSVPPPLPAPADAKQIAAAQKRLGITFPDDYREFLSLHDGYPPLQLLPVAQIPRLSETISFHMIPAQAPWRFYSFAFPPSFDEGDTEAVPGQRLWVRDELKDCLVIGGLTEAYAPPDLKNTAPSEIFPTLLWCSAPEFERARIVSLGESLWAPDFTTYLRYKVTQKIAAQELAESDVAP
ncbi:MAG: SMI1/KNR4 family protein [Proteobacteria bacterium]|nr:SMI1/KNR4 family protein [Pseudomonadota bacterium]MCL2307829.1 SMI1/KNR4 family protein [Pseudomonadota bacterium]